jgi:uncharacterized protein (DUF362 family)
MEDRDKQLYVAQGDDPAALARQLLQQIKPEQGLPKDAKIGIKPNLVVAKSWTSGATTNPAVAEAVIEYFQARGYRDIIIIESASLAEDTAKAFSVCGYSDLARRYGVELVDVKKDKTETRKFGGLNIDISSRVLGLDYLVNLPLIKGHCQTGLTCALKNMKGLIPDREKRRFHAMGLHRPIAYLNRMLKPSLTIADGTCTDPGFEEGGNPKNLRTMLAGTDSVLLDAFAAGLLGYRPDDVEYIRIAEQIGVGSADLSAAEIIRLSSAAQPEVMRSEALESAKAHVSADQACSTCYGNLLSALMRLDLPPDFMISVGQGFKGKAGDIGCGSCTAGFRHCINGCPPSVDDIMAYISQIRRAE